MEPNVLELTQNLISRRSVTPEDASCLDLIAEQLRNAGIEGARIVLEQVGRNSAPAIAAAALQGEYRSLPGLGHACYAEDPATVNALLATQLPAVAETASGY